MTRKFILMPDGREVEVLRRTYRGCNLIRLTRDGKGSRLTTGNVVTGQVYRNEQYPTVAAGLRVWRSLAGKRSQRTDVLRAMAAGERGE